MNLEAMRAELSGIENLEERIAAINSVKQMLKEVSPFTAEPVECVQWVKSDLVFANDYNPNSVAPPESDETGRPHVAVVRQSAH